MISYSMLKEVADKMGSKPYYEKYEFIALRVVDDDYDDYDSKLCEILPSSHVWDDGNYTNDMLDGTSGVNVEHNIGECDSAGYSGKRILVIGGDYAEGGNDIGEIVIKNAMVLEIINF